jgi:hypothetical protein
MLGRMMFGLVVWATQASDPASGHDVRPQRGVGADSVRAVRAAHAAQADFELHRRANLPVVTEGRAERCDERVGRFCYWHDGTAQPRRVDEPAAIVRARELLLAVFDSLARLFPSDGWIAGQRVRYLLEADLGDRAIGAARACSAHRWWCLALEGLALHEAARYRDADSAFARAIAAMPPQEQCNWTDLSILLDGRAADEYGRAACAGRQVLNARLWWLAQPFYSLDGNDLRTEHYARVTMVRVSEGAAGAQSIPWGDDLGELIVRYGWPRWFTRAAASGSTTGPPTVIGHDPEPSFAFIPDLRLLDSALTASDADWQLTSRSARTNYAPAYAIAVRTVPTQVAQFLRGDSMLIVAAYDASRDTLLAHDDLRVALVVAPDEHTRIQTAISAAPTAGSIVTMAPRVPALLSIELLAAGAHATGRTRFAIAPRDATPRVTLSDVLLYDPTGALPRSLPEAVASARASSHASTDRPLGLYWEMYGLPDSGEPVHLSLTIERTNPSWWLRARRAMHLAGSDAPIVLAWADVPASIDGIAARALSVDLSRLAAGHYRLRIELQAAHSAPAVTEREFALDR